MELSRTDEKTNTDAEINASIREGITGVLNSQRPLFLLAERDKGEVMFSMMNITSSKAAALIMSALTNQQDLKTELSVRLLLSGLSTKTDAPKAA